MQLGVCLASQITDIDYAVLAEELGYDDLWFADSQMIWCDVYATMALAAARTLRLRTSGHVAGGDPRRRPGHVIEATCLVGTPTQIADRLRSLETAGLSQLMVLPPVDVKEQVLTDLATKVMPLL